MDYSKCKFCGAEIKKQSDSLHVWEIEYECGYNIYGAIDTETHGDGVTINKKCGNLNE